MNEHKNRLKIGRSGCQILNHLGYEFQFQYFLGKCLCWYKHKKVKKIYSLPSVYC